MALTKVIGDGLATSGLPAGCVLQVVSVTKTSSFSTTSTSYVDVTGLTLAITPSSSSNKILIQVTMAAASTTGASHGYYQLLRDSTAIAVADSAGSRTSSTMVVYTDDSPAMVNPSVCHLDSPSTTSEITYKIQLKASSANAVYVNRSGRDNDAASADGRAVSTITAMEIGA